MAEILIKREFDSPAGNLDFVVPKNAKLLILCATCRRAISVQSEVTQLTHRVVRNAADIHHYMYPNHLIFSSGLPGRTLYNIYWTKIK